MKHKSQHKSHSVPGRGKAELPVEKKDRSFLERTDSTVFYLAFISLFVFFIRIKFLHIPFERDEGVYSYMGQLILDGKTPYIDFYELKPPGLYYLYAAFIYVFGNTIEDLHFGFIFVNIGTIIFICLAGKALLGKTAGIIAAAAYALLSLAPHISGFTVQSEHLIAFFVSGGIFLFLHGIEKNKASYFFGSGLMLGMSALVKQNGLFFIAFAGVMIVCHYVLTRPADRKALFRNTGLYAAGVATMLLLCFAVMLLHGAWDQFIFWTYDYARSYSSAIPLADGLKLFFSTLGRVMDNYTLFWLLALVGLLLAVFADTGLGIFKKIFFSLFTLLSFVAIAPGLRFYGHYWIFLMPCIALLAGLFFYTARALLRKNFSAQVSGGIAAGIFLLAVISNIARKQDYYFSPNPKKILREVYGMNPFPEAKVVGDYIKQRTTAQDKIAVLGSEAEVYFYADRRCPSRHCDAAGLLNAHPVSSGFQREFIRDVEAAKPKYFVLFNNPISLMVFPGADTTLFGWFNTYVPRNYRLVGIADMISPQETRYVWEEEALTYRRQSNYFIGVFQRREEIQNLPAR